MSAYITPGSQPTPDDRPMARGPDAALPQPDIDSDDEAAAVVTVFTDHAATTRREERITLAALAELIRNTTAARKESLPWLKLARFGGARTDRGSLRSNDNVLTITGIEADYDGEQVSFEEARDMLANTGLLAILYTSPSHTEDAPRWRVMCPTKQDYPPDHRDRLMARLNGLFAGIFSRESWALSQSYYFGSVNRSPSHQVAVLDGMPIDQMDHLDAAAIGKPEKPKPATNNGANGQHGDPATITDKRVNGIIESLLDNIRTAADGTKHPTLIAIGRTVGGYLHLTGWSEAQAVERLIEALPATVKDWNAARRAAAWAVGEGAKKPLTPEDRPEYASRRRPEPPTIEGEVSEAPPTGPEPEDRDNLLSSAAREPEPIGQEQPAGQGTAPEVEPEPEGKTEPKPLTKAERTALLEYLADLDGDDYDLERDAAAAKMGGIRLTTLDKMIEKIQQARADAAAAATAAAKAAGLAALRNKPPGPPPPDTDAVKALIAEFNAKYFVLNEAGKAVIYAPKHDDQLHRDYFERIEFADLEKLYLNRTVDTGINEKTGETEYKPAAQVWLRHRKRRQFIGGMVFDPSGRKQDADVLNLWRGFGVKPRNGSCQRFKDHLLNVICSNDRTLYEYVLDWMADVVQRPDKRGEIALVLCGPEGCGKGIFGYAMKYLLGQHGLAISNAKHLIGHFNAHLRDCVLLFADEAFYAGDRAHTSILKAIITESDLLIEAKYQNATPSKNYLHIIMASNERWVVPTSLESRRFVVFAVDISRIGDHAYFAAIQYELEHGGYESLLAELLDRDISQVNLRAIPVTDALVTQRKLSLDTTEAWWLDCLHRGYVFASELGLEADLHEWIDPISTELLFASYMKFCRSRGERRPLSREMLGKWLHATAGGKHTQPARLMVGEHITDASTASSNYASRVAEVVWKDRAPGYHLGTLPDARSGFLKATLLAVEWPP